MRGEKALPLPKILSLEHGRLNAFYDPDIRAQKSFLRKVWQIQADLCTRALVRMDPITGLFLGEPFDGGGNWVGFDAIEWCRGAPNRYIGGCLRPADEFDPARLDPNRGRGLSDEEVFEHMLDRIEAARSLGLGERLAKAYLHRRRKQAKRKT